jgi:hypothetical protein
MKNIFLSAVLGTSLIACNDATVIHGTPDMSTHGTPEDLVMTGTPDDLSMMNTGSPDMTKCTTPGTLHQPNLDAGTAQIFCPFSGTGGGKDVYCNYGTEHCCEPSTGTAACSPIATACPAGDTDWQCQSPGDCSGGEQCCGTGTLNVNANPSCANFATGFHGTHCAATCQATEIVMCVKDSQCANGMTCTPFSTKGAQVGGCH